MRDPFSWSFPIGTVVGVSVRVHFLLPLFMVGMVARYAGAWENKYPPGTGYDAAMLMGLLFVAVLLHEFGHVFAARRMDGEANEILLWPLGGLARCDVPHTPLANFVTALGGPLMNLAICVACGAALAFVDAGYQPPWNPLAWKPFRHTAEGLALLSTWSGEAGVSTSHVGAVVLARLFYVSWVLFLLNMVLVGLPFDAGRLFQCAMWPRVGYVQATRYAIFAGFFLMAVLLVVSMMANDVIWTILAVFIYVTCRQEWIALETGGEDSVFGYDFSQGYTSLERDDPPPPPRRRRQNFFQRWLQRRNQRRMQLAQQQEQADARRMDELLDKIHRTGKESLTDEENRFLKRFADRYKNRPL